MISINADGAVCTNKQLNQYTQTLYNSISRRLLITALTDKL